MGGTTQEKKKRHPTLGDGVVVGAGAILLGPIRVGAGATVGAGSVVVSDVEPGTVVVGVPARASAGRGKSAAEDLEHARLPDPIANAIKFVLTENTALKARIEKIEALEGVVGEMDRRMEDRHNELLKVFSGRSDEGFDGGGGI